MKCYLTKPLIKINSKDKITFDISENLTTNLNGEVKVNTITELNKLLNICNKNNIKILKISEE